MERDYSLMNTLIAPALSAIVLLYIFVSIRDTKDGLRNVFDRSVIRKAIIAPRRWRIGQWIVFLIVGGVAVSGLFLGGGAIIGMPILAAVLFGIISLASIMLRDIFGPFSRRVMFRNTGQISLGFVMSSTAALAAFFAIARILDEGFIVSVCLFIIVMFIFLTIRCGLEDYFQVSQDRKLPNELTEPRQDEVKVEICTRNDLLEMDEQTLTKIRDIETCQRQ